MFKTRVQFKDYDRGYRRRMKTILDPHQLEVEVGVFGRRGRKRKTRSATAAHIMYFHEKGRGVPQRSVIAAWFDENKRENRKVARKLALRRLRGELDVRRSLLVMGRHATKGMKARIAAGIEPPLSPRTKSKKKPLYRMRSSVAFRLARS